MVQILFVDDDPYTLVTLTKAAQVLGHQAITANTGEEALTMAKELKPDLIFSDMQLPDTEGTTLIQQLKSYQDTADIPMFILSASPTEDAIERTQSAGAIAYLDKPIRLQTLSDIIEKHTSG